MTKIRVMFVGEGPSGLPADRIINVFHFWDAGAYDDGKLLDAQFQVARFYGGVGGGVLPTQGSPMGYYMSPWVKRDAQLIAYNLDDAKPRLPHPLPLTLPAAGGNGLPEEVCVVGTLHAAPPVSPRRRGRLYFGPLFTGAADVGTTTHPARPEASFVNDFCKALQTMTIAFDSAPAWSIRSVTPSENFQPIVSGYVDNALDTQRRRGPDTTARQFWTGGP